MQHYSGYPSSGYYDYNDKCFPCFSNEQPKNVLKTESNVVSHQIQKLVHGKKYEYFVNEAQTTISMHAFYILCDPVEHYSTI